MALDPERVGVTNIEVPQVTDFGDNTLDYLTRGGHLSESVEVIDSSSSDDDNDGDGDYDSDDSSYSLTSASSDSDSESDAYHGILPSKFIAFLRT